MSNIDEKLEHFSSVIMKKAAEQRNLMLSQLKHEKEKAVMKMEHEIEKQSEIILHKEKKKVLKEKHDIISEASIKCRHILSDTRNSIMKTVMSDLTVKIQEMISSDEYLAFLEENIQDTIKESSEGELIVYLNNDDINRYPELVNKIKQNGNISVEKAQTDIVGGCIIYNKTKSIYINNSIKAKMEFAEEDFFRASCLKID